MGNGDSDASCINFLLKFQPIEKIIILLRKIEPHYEFNLITLNFLLMIGYPFI